MSREDDRKRKRSPAPASGTTKRARRGGPGSSSRPSSSTQLQREDSPGPSTSGTARAPQQAAQSRSPRPLQTAASALAQPAESRSPGPSSSASSVQRRSPGFQPPRSRSPRPSSAASLVAPVGQERSGGAHQRVRGGTPQPLSPAPPEVPARREESRGRQAPSALLLSRSRSPQPASSDPFVPEEFWALVGHPSVPAGWRLSPMDQLWPHLGEGPLFVQVVLPTVPHPQEVGLYVTATHFMLVTPPWVPRSAVPVLRETMCDSFNHSAYSCEM